MNITMQSIKGLTLDDMKDFLEGSRTVDFDAEGRPVYELMETVLKAQQYRKLTKGQKGTVRRFLVKVTGLSRAQTTRLIARWIALLSGTGALNSRQGVDEQQVKSGLDFSPFEIFSDRTYVVAASTFRLGRTLGLATIRFEPWSNRFLPTH